MDLRKRSWPAVSQTCTCEDRYDKLDFIQESNVYLHVPWRFSFLQVREIQSLVALLGKKTKKKQKKFLLTVQYGGHYLELAGLVCERIPVMDIELDLCVAGEAPKHPCCWFIRIYSLHACLEWFFIHILTEYLNKITWKQFKKNNLVQLVINKQPDVDIKQEESWRDSGGRRENVGFCEVFSGTLTELSDVYQLQMSAVGAFV